MNCPLCNTRKNIIIRRSTLKELRCAWRSLFGFDPFPRNYFADHIDKKRCATCHLEFFDPPLYGDADFYAKISKLPWYYEENKWEFDVAAEFASRLMPKTLLEIGCGEGYFLEKLLPLGLDVEGIDINKVAIKICKAKGLNAEAVNIFNIAKSYDMVVLFEVLEHLENAKELISFITTKLIRPEGHLVIAVPNPEGYFKELGMILLNMPPHHNSGWGLKTFEYLCAQFGLQIIDYQKEPLRYVHYVGLLNGVSVESLASTPISLKQKIVKKLRSMLVNLLAPLTYLSDREKVDGQTHLVIFKKT